MNECQTPTDLWMQYRIMHSRSLAYRHHHAENEIDALIKEFKISEITKEWFWEFLDAIATYYIDGKRNTVLQSVPNQRVAQKLVLDLIAAAETLVEGIPKIEGWHSEECVTKKQSDGSKKTDNDLQTIHEIQAFIAVVRSVAHVGGIDVYSYPGSRLLPLLNEFITGLKPITLINIKGSKGRKFDQFKRFWVNDIVELWTEILGRSFSSKFEGQDGEASEMIQFAFACFRLVETNASMGMVSKPIKEIARQRKKAGKNISSEP